MLKALWLITLFFSSVLVNAGWQDQARRLNGESDSTTRLMISNLKKIPHLQEKMKSAWSTKDRPLALEVISQLNLSELIGFLEEHAFKDPDGYTLLTLNTFLNAQNQQEILGRQLKIYEDSCKSWSPQIHLIILDFMGRTRHKISSSCLSFIDRRRPELSQDLKIYRGRIKP